MNSKRITTCIPLDTRGPKRLWDAGPGFVIRERGDIDGKVKHDYLCPVHGRFEADVPRRDVPDAVPCPHLLCGVDAGFDPFEVEVYHCGLSSPWSPSTIATWKSAGEVTG